MVIEDRREKYYRDQSRRMAETNSMISTNGQNQVAWSQPVAEIILRSID